MQVISIAVLLCVPSVASSAKVAVLATGLEGKAKDEVPSLIDDYVLTAVQDLGGHEVIGPDDVSAVIGFEKEKELLGCDNVACMADIAGALGVDKIVVFKVARVDAEWATTAKLIDIRNTRVEARTSDFVPGSARDLLGAIPGLMKRLFDGDSDAAAVAVSTSSTGPVQSASPEPAPTSAPVDDGPAYEKGWFWWTVGGVAVAAAVIVVVLVASSGPQSADDQTGPMPLEASALLTW